MYIYAFTQHVGIDPTEIIWTVGWNANHDGRGRSTAAVAVILSEAGLDDDGDTPITQRALRGQWIREIARNDR